MTYPDALGQRQLEVREAYQALEQYAADYGREALQLLMHASVPETLRPDLLNIIRVNFLPGAVADTSLEADILFSPLSTALGGRYYQIDPQVRWHCLALLRSLYRDDPRPRTQRLAELLWRYVQSMEQHANRHADPQLAEYLDIQRWVALSFLDPATAARAFAAALREGTEPSATAAMARLGGLASAIELPLANEPELISYARGLDALVAGNEDSARTILGKLGEDELHVYGVTLKSPVALLEERLNVSTNDQSASSADEVLHNKTCYVIQGFGKKTDYTDGRVLDLDASYAIIKEAVEAAGLKSVRADEIENSTVINVPIYEMLLEADLVIADLSTYNLNAAYELGVRFGLRPHGTIVIAEEGFKNPFDVGHIAFFRYKHLGEDIGARETIRFRNDLTHDILKLLTTQKTDSPVYDFIPRLIPPTLTAIDFPEQVSSSLSWLDRDVMRTCFVVQGFGKNTDYTDGRVLNLDASYAIIKEGVEAAGLQCIRADEIQHSTVIDVPMYEMLLQADVVIADLSTYNVNAAYELGMRYALRPKTTIVVAEEGFKNPFDFGHIALRRYKHMGEDIGLREAVRFKSELKTAIEEILASNRVDSPVYTFLPKLTPPQLKPSPAPLSALQGLGSTTSTTEKLAENAGAKRALNDLATPKAMLDGALAMINPPEGGACDFVGARALLLKVMEIRPNDPFVAQQLVIATYKSKQPDPQSALLESRRIIEQSLDPATTNDPETLALWGAIHKRLWELRSLPADLNEAVNGYERGFSVRRDWYNGINYAFLLDLRALEWLKIGKKDDANFDSGLARRVRSDVGQLALAPAEDMEADPKKRFWAVATLWEAALGRGDTAETARWGAAAEALNVPQWMQEARLYQGQKLLALQKEFASLSAS